MKRITVHALETICWIARLGTFSAAAHRLQTTQPAISARVRDLEGILGVRLFQRRGRGVELTIQGRALLKKAEPLYRQIEEFVLAIGLPGAFEGTMRIGAGNICMSWFPALMARIAAEMPRLHIEVDVGNAEHLIEGLDSGRLDVAIVSGSVDAVRYSTQSLGFEHMRWVCTPALRTRLRRALGNGAPTERLPVWCVPRSSFFHARAMSKLAELGVGDVIVHTINNMAAAVDLTTSGVGVGLLPETLIQGLLEEGRLVPLSSKLTHEPVEFLVVCTRQDEPQRLVSRIMTLATEASNFSRQA